MVTAKKMLPCLLLVLVLATLALSTVHIEPVKAAPTEKMVNGGFETGDFTGWDAVSSSSHIVSNVTHSGTYSCLMETEGIGAWTTQHLSPEVPVADVTTIGFYYNTSSTVYIVEVIFNGDSSYVDLGISSSSGAWLYFDCTPMLSGHSSDTISAIEIITGVSSGEQIYLDDFSLMSEAAPTEYLCRFRFEPSGLFLVHYAAGGSWYWTEQDLNITAGSETFVIDSSSLIVYVGSTLIYGFDHWSITNTTGTFNSTGSSLEYNLQEDTNITMAYTTISIQVSASPVLPAYFSSEYYGSNFSAPQTLNWNSGIHNFTCLTYTYYPNSSYVYTFDHWLVNGTDIYGSLSLYLDFTADTNLTMVYLGSTVTPSYPFQYVSGALNATWYFRSDTHTIHTILGYKLLTVNTNTAILDERGWNYPLNVSYGVRVWVLDLFGNQIEITSGEPVAVATKTTNGTEMMIAYWTCPAYGSMIDSVKVNMYQKFGSNAWSLREIFITGSDLLIRLPSSTWTFHYWVNRTQIDGYTYSTFGYGSYTTYNSRIDLQYYKASPWDVALARLWQRQYFSFMFTPWTYWFGDLFWSILLFGMIIMAWLKSGSLKPVLSLLWILGGSGSILWALIPATALHAAVLMLALAMAISLFRLIYGRRT